MPDTGQEQPDSADDEDAQAEERRRVQEKSKLVNEKSDARKQPESQLSDPIKLYTHTLDYVRSEFAFLKWAYTATATVAAIFVGIGMYFTYGSASDFRKESKQNMKEMQVEFRDLIEKRIDEELSTESVQARIIQIIEEIAVPIIHKRIGDAITPQMTIAQDEIAELKTSGELLETRVEFTLTVIKAQNEDRPAFDRLRKWSQKQSFPLQEDAVQAWAKILGTHASPIFMSGYTVPWSEGIDPSTLSLERLKDEYSVAPVNTRIGLVEYIWGRADFPKQDRMAFLVEVLETDESLRVVEIAGRLFLKESKQPWTPLAVEQMIQWWSENREKMESHQPEN